MKRSFRCLPIGDLPYDNEKATTKMMVKLFENVPFLANLPNISPKENLIQRTLSNIPGIHIKDKKIVFNDNEADLKTKLQEMDEVFNSPTMANLSTYAFESAYLDKYLQVIERIKPAQTVISLMGPFTLSQRIVNKNGTQMLADKFYRKVIVQAICVKAMWMIGRIRMVSPDTMPIILLEEPLLNKVGDVKRENEDISSDIIVNMLAKIVECMQECGAYVGVQCFEKCDWKIPIEAGVDLISFDAYNNPNNLNIIPEKINEFLARGGCINWAIVPVMNETLVKSLNIDMVYNRFIKTIEGLVESGTSERLTYNHSLVSLQGNINELPIIFAEKALILATQLAKRIPVKS